MTFPFASNLDPVDDTVNYLITFDDQTTRTVYGVGAVRNDNGNLHFYASADATGEPLLTVASNVVAGLEVIGDPVQTVHVVNAATAQQTADQAAQTATAAAGQVADILPQVQAAADAAAAAVATAEVAQTAANGKNRITHSTTDPSGDGANTGDVWFRRTAAGLITGQWEWDGTAWQPRTLSDALFTTISAAKIATGTLQAGVEIIAGSETGNRMAFTAAGLRGVTVAGGVETVALSYDLATGLMDTRGVFRTATAADRSVLVAANIGSYGGTVAQPGILFRMPTSVNRWAQVYATNNDLHLDGPAFTDTQGIHHPGASWRVNIDGLYGYTTGNNGDATVVMHNNGYWRIGPHNAGPAYTWASGDGSGWRMGNTTAGTIVGGASDGTFWLGDLNVDKCRVQGTATTLTMVNKVANSHVTLGSTGDWTVGNTGARAVYTSGNRLVFRDRQVAAASGMEAFVAPGSWFDVRVSDSGATQGGMYVHGRFGASVKNFIIDHPTDGDRQLVHAATESPVAGVEYWGTVDLDTKGEAVVEMPRYFEGLTHTAGRAVLITPIGRPAPVGASEIVDGRFTVYGPNKGRVSWLVKAARKDANAHFDVEPLRTDTGLDTTRDNYADPGPPPPPSPEAPDPGPARRPQAPPAHAARPGGKHGQPL